LLNQKEERTMKHMRCPLIYSVLAGVLGLAATAAAAAAASLNQQQVERGRYLARIAGCNDCHTPGYAASDGQVPERLWLTGDSFGWRGAWGTTYGSNLRLFVNGMSEDQWVEVARTLKRKPPMPWFNLNKMSEPDLRALYQFIVSLGEPGQAAPTFVPPGQEPKMPYATFPAFPPVASVSKK
jgi:mono/diheme cytochrome c family protein